MIRNTRFNVFISENGCNDHFEPIGDEWCIRSFAYPKTYSQASAMCDTIGATLTPVISEEMNVSSITRYARSVLIKTAMLKVYSYHYLIDEMYNCFRNIFW